MFDFFPKKNPPPPPHRTHAESLRRTAKMFETPNIKSVVKGSTGGGGVRKKIKHCGGTGYLLRVSVSLESTRAEKSAERCRIFRAFQAAAFRGRHSAPLRSASCGCSNRRRFFGRHFASLRSVALRFASRRVASLRFSRRASAPLRFAPLRLASLRFASLRVPAFLAPCHFCRKTCFGTAPCHFSHKSREKSAPCHFLGFFSRKRMFFL